MRDKILRYKLLFSFKMLFKNIDLDHVTKFNECGKIQPICQSFPYQKTKIKDKQKKNTHI